MSLPRVVVAAPATGQGKTTVATGLMAALHRHRGLEVSGHKAGPDYIDPGYHALATGRPGRNLDPHLVGDDLLVPLLLHGAGPLPGRPGPADVAILEGVMGLFDGRLGTGGFASTAHVAGATRSPVLLVVDVARASRTAAALVHGLATWDATVTVAGVVLNRAGSDRNTREIVGAIESGGPSGHGVPVVGVLPHEHRVSAPSRHLGLVPADERAESASTLDALADLVAAHVDLDAVLGLARSAPGLEAAPWRAGDHVGPPAGAGPAHRPVVAVAGGRAFTFRYAETDELLRAAGCQPVAFDPATDPGLPPGTAGLYLGGGFPEAHAEALSRNAPLRRAIADAVAAGVPTVAECAGLLYLAESLDGHPMAGAVPATAAMTERLVLAYDALEAAGDTLLTRTGETVTAHEFHRTACAPEAPPAGAAGPGGQPLGPAWLAPGPDGPRPVGWAGPTLHAAYPHVHWAGHPRLAQRFADAVHRQAGGG